MCLQVCHVRKIVMDNHLACSHCPPGVRYGKEGASCDGQSPCRHWVTRQGKPPMCALTRYALPKARVCCHHDAAPLTRRTFAVFADGLADGLLAATGAQTPAALFDSSGVAYHVEGDGVPVIHVDSLGVPLVYGLPSYEWGEG